MEKQQVIDVLKDLQEYFRWMYYSEDAKIKMESKQIDFEGEKFSVKVRKDGNYGMVFSGGTLDGLEMIVQNWYINAPPPENSLENVQWNCAILNPQDIPEDKREFAHRCCMFLSSTFTRTIAFCFFARMQPVTIEGIANDLALK
jgi:hypothetical protein